MQVITYNHQKSFTTTNSNHIRDTPSFCLSNLKKKTDFYTLLSSGAKINTAIVLSRLKKILKILRSAPHF